jgi:eukaryotic-like serine/threonine-protein kinase
VTYWWRLVAKNVTSGGAPGARAKVLAELGTVPLSANVPRRMVEAPTNLSERALARVGSTLRRGKYVLEALLGIGAMGAVYAATHRNGMHVAIKILHQDLARVEDVRSRFLREGYIANLVQHQGLVRVLDDDIDDDGSTFLVMELLEGCTLATEWAWAGHVLPLSRVAPIADALLDALDAIHAAGIVHRDIKPENVFLVRGGPLKLLDLGIARILIESRQTMSGEIMGTPEFMAPEQAQGHLSAIDGRTDIYSVGATMFTLLTGRPVHEARTPMEAMVFGATLPARSLLEVWPAAPPLVVNVVDVALSFEQARRWSSAAEMRVALRNAMRVVSVPPAQLAGPAASPPRGSSGTVLGSGPTAHVEGRSACGSPPPVPLVREKG